MSRFRFDEVPGSGLSRELFRLVCVGDDGKDRLVDVLTRKEVEDLIAEAAGSLGMG